MNRIDVPPISRIDARDLRLVAALANAGTTAGAASVLHLTQPAVSRALIATEEKLGVQLFDRTPRGLEPTTAGLVVLDSASRLLAELADLEYRVKTPATSPVLLRLVCECYTAYHWVPGVVETLQASMPGLELAIALEHTRNPMAALEAGDIDVALVTAAAMPRGALMERPLFADEVVFVMAAENPLAAKAALTPADLTNRPLLTAHLPTPDMHWFHKPMRSTGRKPLRFQHVPLTEAILDFARADMGIAVLSEWIAAPHLRRGDLVARRMASGPLLRPWRLVWRREVKSAALRLHSVLQHLAPRMRELPATQKRLVA